VLARVGTPSARDRSQITLTSTSLGLTPAARHCEDALHPLQVTTTVRQAPCDATRSLLSDVTRLLPSELIDGVRGALFDAHIESAGCGA